MVKPGYKHTEVGKIPEDWDVSTIGSHTVWSSGGTPSRNNVEFWNGSIPWISGSTLKSSEIFTSDQFLTKEAVVSGSKMAPLNSTLLLVRGSALHNEIRAGLVVAPVSFNQDVKALLPDKSIEPKYLTFFILGHSNKLLKLVSSAGNSAGVLDTALVQNFQFLKPPIEEQKAIAKALSDVDELIVSLEKLIAKKRNIKTATMQQLLTGKKRLPGLGEGKGYQQTELGEIPEDWELMTVYETVDEQKSLFNDGDWIEAEHITDRGVRLVQTGNIGVGVFVEKDNKKYIFHESFHKLKCKELHKGDILICRLAEPAGRACIFQGTGDEIVVTSVDVTIYRPDTTRFSREYINQYFSTSQWFNSVLEHVGGTTHKRISRGALGKLLIPLPLMKEQIEIGRILSDMDTSIGNIEHQLEKTKAIKQGMMQELLTGRTRLI